MLVPYQDATTPPVPAEARRRGVRAVVVLTLDGRMLEAGRGCLFVLGRLGWPRVAALAAHRPLVWLVELGYRVVTRNRVLLARLLPAWDRLRGRR